MSILKDIKFIFVSALSKTRDRLTYVICKIDHIAFGISLDDDVRFATGFERMRRAQLKAHLKATIKRAEAVGWTIVQEPSLVDIDRAAKKSRVAFI